MRAGEAEPCSASEKSVWQYRVLTHVTFEKVDFEGGVAKLIFCVRWWPSHGQQPEHFELDVKCWLLASGADVDSSSCFRRPQLLWDDSESVGFKWHPPMLPSMKGRQEVDWERRCIVSHFAPRSGHQAWRAKLAWQGHSGRTRPGVPWTLWAMLQLHDGRPIHCPGSGNGCFEIPLRRDVDDGSGREVAELRGELAQLHAQLRQAEAQQRHSPRLQRTLLPRDNMRGSTLAAQPAKSGVLREELSHRRGRIRIFGRIRGYRPEEEVCKEQNAVVKISQTEVALPSLRRSFEFDLVFGPEAQTLGVWDEVSPLVDTVLDQPGMHACVMAYGQTGAGKTFTMEGSPEQPGLIAHTVEHLFSRVAEEHGLLAKDGPLQHVEISVSMIEIYQEQLYDLLNPGTIDGGRVTLRHDGGDRRPEVRGLQIVSPETREDAMTLYQSGTRLRRLGVSERNARSSRSHTVFSLYVKRYTTGSEDASTVSKISLVDLAGSERQSAASDYDRARVSEACSINRSLTTLGKVVQACVSRSSTRGPESARVHVPYRDSVLTRLLSDSIGGQAKTLIIVHVTPHVQDTQESRCTLQFAANAACVQEHAASGGKEEHSRREAGANLLKVPTPCRSAKDILGASRSMTHAAL